MFNPEFITTVNGFVVPDAPSDQPVNKYSEDGIAVNITLSPFL